MLENLSGEERRQALLTSRLHFSPEFAVPRLRAMAGLIENVLWTYNENEWCSAQLIADAMHTLSGFATLHLTDLEQTLGFAQQAQRVESRMTSDRRPEYRLTTLARREKTFEFEETSRLVGRILDKLYKKYINHQSTACLSTFFTDVVCRVFSALGAQWASYITGTTLADVLTPDRLEVIIHECTNRHGIAASHLREVKRRTAFFFKSDDSDFSQYKFNVGQSVYIASLIGMNGSDLLSDETFRNGKLYLDASVIIPALLSESRHHRVFHQLLAVTQRLGITVLVARPTADEVRNVAALQQRLGAEVYDDVPESLSSHVRGDFFHTYRALKEIDPDAAFGAVFDQFEDLSGTLGEFGIQIVDDTLFEYLKNNDDLSGVEDAISKASEQVRHRKKFKNAVTHDAVLFRYLRSTTESTDKVWLVTRDSSLPTAWHMLEPEGLTVKCFQLDGLLQSITPFAIPEDGDLDFAQLFSDAVQAQLMPQSKLFDIEDFKVFKDLAINCKELDDHTIEEGLQHLKQTVLKGASYNSGYSLQCAYELHKLFSRRRDQEAAWTKEREKLEQQVARLNDSLQQEEVKHSSALETLKREHEIALSGLGERIKQLEKATEQQQREAGLGKARRQTIVLLAVAAVVFIGLASRYGHDATSFDRIALLWKWEAAGLVLVLFVCKFLFFRATKISEIFPWVTEFKDFLKY